MLYMVIYRATPTRLLDLLTTDSYRLRHSNDSEWYELRSKRNKQTKKTEAWGEAGRQLLLVSLPASVICLRQYVADRLSSHSSTVLQPLANFDYVADVP